VLWLFPAIEGWTLFYVFIIFPDYDVVIATIPAGARNIKIEEASASENNLCK